MEKKRLLVLADLHCGHRVGLTPPAYQSAIPGNKYYQIQVGLWAEYVKKIEALKPIDILVVNGDAVDGKGQRSGGTELLTTEMKKQAEMAAECIRYTEAGKVIIVRGTPYHVGESDENEDTVAEKVGAVACGDHEWIDVNGVVFDFKHFVGASSIPHGRFTALAKDKLWNTIWNHEHEQQPDADVLIRSHVHSHHGCFDPYFLGMTTPALQAAGTKFGARKCSGVVHWGFLWFDVFEDGSYAWNRHITVLESQKIKPIKL